MEKRYRFLGPGEGANYKWSNDHSYVKVSERDTGGAYTLIEDNLSPEFSLGLHVHRQHAESFYILEGTIPFFIDGDWHDAGPGTTIHIPPGVPHAVARCGESARMLMIMQPAGFDRFLEALQQCTQADFEDEAKMTALSEQHDIFSLGPVPPR